MFCRCHFYPRDTREFYRLLVRVRYDSRLRVLSELLAGLKPGLLQVNVALAVDVLASCGEEALMLYMVIERFKNRDAIPVYRRFQEKGRMAPAGLNYVDSWVETNFDRCFQLMECDDARLLEEWADNWRDLVDFEFVPVRTSNQAVEFIAPKL